MLSLEREVRQADRRWRVIELLLFMAAGALVAIIGGLVERSGQPTVVKPPIVQPTIINQMPPIQVLPTSTIPSTPDRGGSQP